MVESHGQDKYKRTLGDIFLSDGTHVNLSWWRRAGVGGTENNAPEAVILAALKTAARVPRK
jgi:hypothetical protein